MSFVFKEVWCLPVGGYIGVWDYAVFLWRSKRNALELAGHNGEAGSGLLVLDTLNKQVLQPFH